MNTYDFSKNIKLFNGTEIAQNGKIASILAQAIGQENGKHIPPRKAGIWGIDLEKNGILQIDDADKRTLINYIESPECPLPNLTKYQILEVLEGQ